MSAAQRDQWRLIEKDAYISYYTSAALVITGTTLVGTITGHSAIGFGAGAVGALAGLFGGLINHAPLRYDTDQATARKMCNIILREPPPANMQCVIEGIKTGLWESNVFAQWPVAVIFVLSRALLSPADAINKPQSEAAQAPNKNERFAQPAALKT